MSFILDEFISKFVTLRPESMFLDDIEEKRDVLRDKIHGSSMLVIGGAGSIGSSFIKAVLPFEPASLIVVDTNENALTELTRDLRSTYGLYIPKDYVPYPMDYSSPVFAKMFRARGGFDYVANFSAHKHVRSEKDIFSIESLIRNNVINAKALLELLSEYPPKTYFCVSTDKAANPVNIMGASKRIMEDLIFAYSDRFDVKTARFANVAFSNGSLPAGFLERINKRQPISAPSDVKRYFVSPEESGQICMLSCMLGSNREIFFPKLDESQMMTFDDIARNLLTQRGFRVLECDSDQEAIIKARTLREGDDVYPVHFSRSDTSGEKQYEEFYTDDETIDLNRFKALGVIEGKAIPDKAEVNAFIDELVKLFGGQDIKKADVVNLIKQYLPEFNHIETDKKLDDKM
ncbi:Polysaccharide biosynthesis protein [Lachnospiraceae bacterium XBB2008]|nr:Polysaccharide biosynthesis protein [Lachnospiraceae bacterium XBB2008]